MSAHVEAARLMAHEHALRTDPVYRSLIQSLTTERVTACRPRRRSTRRLWSVDRLPLSRAFMTGPRWRRHFDVREVPIAEIDPGAVPYHRPGRKLLVFTLEEDVRERVLEELQPGVFAQWSDLRERLGLPR